MGYSDAWRTGAYRQPAIAGARDPNHASPEPVVASDNWATGSAQSAVDHAVVEAPGIYALDSAPGGHPFTPPDHQFGVGYGAGLDFAASSAQNDAAHLIDEGSYQQRMWNYSPERDGSYNVDRLQMTYDDDGLRPAGTPDLPAAPGMQQGLNRSEYPGRRVGHYITRWRDRSFARRTWDVEFRPVITPNAYTAPAKPAVAAGGPYVSPYGAAQNTQVRVLTAVAPQLRRTPAPWDQSITTDGTAASPYVAADAGFQAWGL